MKRLLYWRCAAVFCFPTLIYPQGPGASITGEVRDPSGAIIASAIVTARNTGTNVTRTTMSDSAGVFLLGPLPPASYEITVEIEGFKREVRSGVLLQVGQQVGIDFTLSLGNPTEAVTVVAEAAITATESASTGQVIENKKVTELPLNSREFYSLALLAPGAYQPAQNSTLGFRGVFNVAGANETANNFSVNGIDNNDTGINGPSFRPSVDSIQEFRLLTGIFPAEYGRSSGSQVIIVTKSVIAKDSVFSTLAELRVQIAATIAERSFRSSATPIKRYHFASIGQETYANNCGPDWYRIHAAVSPRNCR